MFSLNFIFNFLSIHRQELVRKEPVNETKKKTDWFFKKPQLLSLRGKRDNFLEITDKLFNFLKQFKIDTFSI